MDAIPSARWLLVAAALTALAAGGCDGDDAGEGGSSSASAAVATSATSTSGSSSTQAAGSPDAAASASSSSSSSSATAVSSTAAPSSSATGGALDFTGDVTRYEYALDLEGRVATSRLFVSADTTGNCFAVACEPALTDVTFGGDVASSVTQSPTDAEICGAMVDAGSTVEVVATMVIPEVTFLDLDVGLSTKTNLGGGSFTYLLSWVGGCDHFGPCDDDPSRLAHFGFDVSHDTASTVLCPGVRTTPAPGHTRCEIAATPAPTYSAFAVLADDRWVRAPFVEAAGVNFVFYEAPAGGLRASLQASEVAAFFEWVTARWGPFPFGDELRIAAGPTAWLGFEHPANIVLHDQLGSITTDYQNTLMHVLMHEIIHQYAGNRTTLASELDFVWKEAVAEYMTYVWEDMSRPAGEATASLAYWDAVSLQSEFYPRPEDEPPPALATFYGHVYGPGPMTLFVQLEDLIGRDAVLGGIDDFLSVSGARSVEDLRDALEISSGQSLAGYFDTWVFGSGAPVWPRYATTAVVNGADLDVTVTQTNAQGGNAHPAVVALRIVTDAGTFDVEASFGLDPIGASRTVTVPGAGEATEIIVDPDHRLINDVMGAAPPAPRPVWIF